MPKNSHYCTYFDFRYVTQALAMIESLRAQDDKTPVWALCLDKTAEKIMSSIGLDNVFIIPLSTLERHFLDLAKARADRSLIEYYFTLTPHLVQYVFDTVPVAERVAYLDGDLYFFADPAVVWLEMNDAPVALIPHNFHSRAKRFLKYGNYNVGWVSFGRTEQGQACLDFWRRSCRQWCRDKPEGGKFADQGYLNSFHECAPDLVVIHHKGCNVGPWNIARFPIRFVDGRVKIGDEPLVFFHFTGFKKGALNYWFNSHRIYRGHTNAVMRDQIYLPYLMALMKAKSRVAPHMVAIEKGVTSDAYALRLDVSAPRKTIMRAAARYLFQLLDLATGMALREPKL